MEQKFYEQIKCILSEARDKVYQTANFAMVEAYWDIGKSIVTNSRVIETDDNRFWERFYANESQIYEAVLFDVSNSSRTA